MVYVLKALHPEKFTNYSLEVMDSRNKRSKSIFPIRSTKRLRYLLTKSQMINPDIKAMHADSTTKGKISKTAFIIFLAAVPGGLLVAIKATPGDSTRLMYAYSPKYFVMYLFPYIGKLICGTSSTSASTSRTFFLAERKPFPFSVVSMIVLPCGGHTPQAVRTMSVTILLKIPSSLLSFLFTLRYGEVVQ